VEDTEVRERVARVEHLLGRVEDDPAALEALQAVVDLYGEALRRLAARGSLDGTTDDELVAHLLLVHGLHPDDLETRVREALDDVRPYLGTHGGDVELLGVEDGVAKLRLAGTCNGCPSSTVTLRTAIEEALLRAAPDLERIDAEGVAEPQPVVVQLGSLQCPTELQKA
jgi:Fe-S cluster biogenesis protein NfuA